MKAVSHPALIFAAGVVVTLVAVALMGALPSMSALGSHSEKKTPHVSTSLVGATQITCTYHEVLGVNYFEGNVTHSLPPEEKEPLIFTFSELNSEVGTLKSIDSTRTISETPVVKLEKSANTLTYVEGTGENYITTHKIFLDSGVAIYTKEVDIMGIPAGSLAMGTCVPY